MSDGLGGDESTGPATQHPPRSLSPTSPPPFSSSLHKRSQTGQHLLMLSTSDPRGMTRATKAGGKDCTVSRRLLSSTSSVTELGIPVTRPGTP